MGCFGHSENVSQNTRLALSTVILAILKILLVLTVLTQWGARIFNIVVYIMGIFALYNLTVGVAYYGATAKMRTPFTDWMADANSSAKTPDLIKDLKKETYSCRRDATLVSMLVSASVFALVLVMARSKLWITTAA